MYGIIHCYLNYADKLSGLLSSVLIKNKDIVMYITNKFLMDNYLFP